MFACLHLMYHQETETTETSRQEASELLNHNGGQNYQDSVLDISDDIFAAQLPFKNDNLFWFGRYFRDSAIN